MAKDDLEALEWLRKHNDGKYAELEITLVAYNITWNLPLDEKEEKILAYAWEKQRKDNG